MPVDATCMPELVSLASTEFYQVTPGQQVTLEVTTEEGQTSSTSLLLDGQPQAFIDGGGPQPVGSHLAGSVLYARTVVSDINPDTNRTVVMYELRGGPQSTRFAFSRLSANKGPAHYIIAFVFTNDAV